MDQGRARHKAASIVLFAIAFLMGVGYVVMSADKSPVGGLDRPDAGRTSPSFVGPTRTLRPTRTPQPSPTPSATAEPEPTAQLRVGIVAGHWKNDPGAVCPDGLQEVDINLDVASQVVEMLGKKGYVAELLPEFSEELSGYKADAFVSIHSDSCTVPAVSGFKVARIAASAIPDTEDRLVACLSQEYAQGTGLSFHRNSITFDMTDYHAFREIDPQTPGAIIELGFMSGDRELLTKRSAAVARAVTKGILCFLEGD